MAQTRLTASGVSSQADVDKIVSAGEAVAGARFVNVKLDDGTVVVTHSDDFNVEDFKAALKAAGYSAS